MKGENGSAVSLPQKSSIARLIMEETAMPCPYPKIIGRDTALPSPLMAGHPTQKIQSTPLADL